MAKSLNMVNVSFTGRFVRLNEFSKDENKKLTYLVFEYDTRKYITVNCDSNLLDGLLKVGQFELIKGNTYKILAHYEHYYIKDSKVDRHIFELDDITDND